MQYGQHAMAMFCHVQRIPINRYFAGIQVKCRTNTHKLISEPTPKYKQLLVRKMWAQKQKGPDGSRGSPLSNVQISI